MLGRLLVVLAFVSVQVSGQDDVNPFKTPSAKPATDPVAPAEVPSSLDVFEFNGIMEIGGVTRISLYDTNAKRNIWVSENEIGEFGISFRRYDDENETVVIDQGGLSKKLALNKVKIESLKIAPSRQAGPTPVATAGNNANQGGNVSRPGGRRVETDEEARARIQRVAEEIRRRRAERRQQLEERNRNASN